jgi:hypothetical protein
MVAQLKVDMIVAADGTLHLAEDVIESAGLKPGDQVSVLVSKAEAPEEIKERISQREEIDLDNLPHWTPEELFERFRIDEPIDVEEAIRQGEEDAAREFMEEYERSLRQNG